MITLFVSCSDELFVPESTFKNLNGTYVYYKYESWNQGLYERSEYDSWEFNNSIKAWRYRNYWSYTSSGWINATKDGDSYYIEWKVEGNQFFEKLWDNSYSTWESHSFQYIDNNQFKLDGKLYVKED